MTTLRRLGLGRAFFLGGAGLGAIGLIGWLAAAWLYNLPGVEDVGFVFTALIVIVVSVSLLAITARRLDRSRHALEQTQRQTRDLIDLASDGFFLADIEGRYIDVNEAGCRMLGYTREEILQKTVMDLVAPEDLLRLEHQRNELLRGAVKISDWNLVCKDGRLLPTEVSTKILPDGRWQAFIRDISERTLAEEELHQVQERLDLALKGADLGLWDWNVVSDDLVVNSRFMEMRALGAGEIASRGDDWFAGIHPDDAPGVRNALKAHFENVLPGFGGEFRMSTRDGSWIWVLSRGRVASRDERGRPERIVGTVLDITARKRAEDEVRLSEAKFSGIISISADAIISIDEDQKITLFNKGAENIFGWSSAEVIGKPLDILVPERLKTSHARHVEMFAAGAGAARQMGAGNGAIFGVRKSGDEFPADASISGLLIDGRKILTVAIRDVTQLKEAEDRARRAIQSRDDILGIVAHDLRNPLTSIATLAHILRMKRVEVDIANEITEATTRMNRLIADLLDVTRLESGRLSLKQERLPAAKIIADALGQQAPLAFSAAIELRFDAAPKLPDIWADRDRLLQIFQNLIGNAIKFTERGGLITLDATAQAGEVMFSVSDTGQGIPYSDLPHVFDRFWQAPGTERRGLGFGLAIVKGLVEAHGGRVWVQSLPGQGSTFFFTIPQAAAQTAANHAAE